MLHRVALVGLVALVACQPAAPNPQLVTQWVRVAIDAAQSEQLDAQVAARAAAYLSIAAYEGYATDPRSNLHTLAGQLNGLWRVPMVEVGRPVDGATVSAEAARVVLDSLFEKAAPATRARIDSLARAHVEARRRGRVRDVVRERSVLHGQALGNAIIAWASSDGFLATRNRAWRPAAGESKWNVAEAKPIEPHWGALRTFVLRNGDECVVPPLPAYSLRAGSEFWKMGKEVLDSARAVGDSQRAVMAFWSDSASAAAPVARWLSVLTQLATQRRETADRVAEMHLLASVAMADAFIASSREQFRSLVTRPVTYVNRVFDRRWSPAFPTPVSPAYPSTHAALSGAAAEVLDRFFGDNNAFTDSGQVVVRAMSRGFRNFSHAVDEAALSRVYGGVEYLPSVMGGKAQGRCVGERVLGRLRTR